MPNYDAGSGQGTLRLEVTYGQYNVAGNYTPVSWALYLICGNGVSWNANAIGWEVVIDGVRWAGQYTADFRGGSVKLISNASFNVPHFADGTKAIGGYGYTQHTGMSAIGGPIQAHIAPAIDLPRIPRGPRVEWGGQWRQSILYAEWGGQWRQCLLYAEWGGQWRLCG